MSTFSTEGSALRLPVAASTVLGAAFLEAPTNAKRKARWNNRDGNLLLDACWRIDAGIRRYNIRRVTLLRGALMALPLIPNEHELELGSPYCSDPTRAYCRAVRVVQEQVRTGKPVPRPGKNPA